MTAAESPRTGQVAGGQERVVERVDHEGRNPDASQVGLARGALPVVVVFRKPRWQRGDDVVELVEVAAARHGFPVEQAGMTRANGGHVVLQAYSGSGGCRRLTLPEVFDVSGQVRAGRLPPASMMRQGGLGAGAERQSSSIAAPRETPRGVAGDIRRWRSAKPFAEIQPISSASHGDGRRRRGKQVGSSPEQPRENAGSAVPALCAARRRASGCRHKGESLDPSSPVKRMTSSLSAW